MNLAGLGEFGFIGTIAARVRQGEGVIIGIGDDAAVTLPAEGMSILTTADLLAEGVHFDLGWSDPRTLGRKSLAVNLSDIAAMGGIPRHVLLSLAIPLNLPERFLEGFIEGFLEQAGRFGVSLIGGDTSASRGGLFINVTLIGEQLPRRIVTRSGAQTGDLVCVSGNLGDSALGLELLRAGILTGEAVKRHLDPEPRVVLGRMLAEAGILTSMIDVSDGLVADLGHILRLSGRGGRIAIADLPLSSEYGELADRYCSDRYSLCLGGGEDYELLFTLPEASLELALDIGRAAQTQITVIGEVVDGTGVCLVAPDDSRYEPRVSGYDHFRETAGR